MKFPARTVAAVAALVFGVGLIGPRSNAVLAAASGTPESSGVSQVATSLAGTVRGRGNQPVAGVTVNVTIGSFSDSTTTDSAGQYFLAAPSGAAFVQIWGSGPSGTAPDNFYAERSGVLVTGATTLDFTLNVVQVSGVVSNPDASGATDAELTFYVNDFSAAGRTASNATVTAGLGGGYSVLVLAGSAVVAAFPSIDGAIAVTRGLNLTSDTALDLRFGTTVTVTGVIRGLNGAPIPNAVVTAIVGESTDTAVTDSTGAYTLTKTGTGPAFIQVSGVGPIGVAPDQFYVTRSSTVSSATVFDVNLPVVQLTGAVSSTDGTPASDVALALSSSGGTLNGSNGSSGSASTDANGLYSVLLLGDSVEATLFPPPGSPLIPQARSFALTTDKVESFSLAIPTGITGTVRGRGAVPVADATVTVSVASIAVSGATDANGVYSFLVPSGSAVVQASGTGGAGTPDDFISARQSVLVNGQTTSDVDVPAVQVTGLVVDANGVVVPNTTVTSNTSDTLRGSYSASTAHAGLDGTFSYLLLTGEGTATMSPLPASGFAETTVPAVVTGDQTQLLTIQHDDVTPPQIVAGPSVVHVSDGSATIAWTTNRPSTSVVEFGIGVLGPSSEDTALTTDHVVTLTGLAAATGYVFRAGSTDGSGNGPAFSAQGSFRTQVTPGDFSAPAIIGGPTVVFADATAALIEWKTDEPASSVVEFGTPSTLLDGDPGHFRVVHRVRLSGLLPDTDYAAIVRSADPNGNPTASSAFTFHTPAVPDATAPVITFGPVATAKTDHRIVVSWTTNEPATSGVSFNDGTAYDLTSDAALTTTHEMTIAGLTAATPYHLTVSSTDAAGNGPTLGGGIDVTTDATPDVTPPAISGPTVNAITARSASISLATNELSYAVVKFGSVAGSPDGAQSDLTLDASHALLLNGLQGGTTYFFVVQVTDVAGNTTQSTETSFTTQPTFVDLPPSPPGPLTVPASPTRATIIHISWGASTDDHGVTGYEIQRDGTAIGTVDQNTLAFDDTSAAEGSHVYRVGALDMGSHVTLSDPATVVVDRTPPVLTVPSDILTNAVGTTATVTFHPTAADDIDLSVAVTCAPPSGSAFHVGVTTVSCSATDTAGNTATGSFTVTVRDVTAPTITSFTPSLQVLWPPNHQMVALTIRVTVFDAVDPAPVCRILSISSNEPINGLGDGDTAPDWSFSGLSFSVRAERGGGGNGRIYTITGECRDASGNASQAQTTVRVPKSPSK